VARPGVCIKACSFSWVVWVVVMLYFHTVTAVGIRAVRVGASWRAAVAACACLSIGYGAHIDHFILFKPLNWATTQCTAYHRHP